MSASSSYRASYADDERSYRPSSSHTSHSVAASRDGHTHAQSHSAKDKPAARQSPPRSPSPPHARLRTFSSSATASPLRPASIPASPAQPARPSHGASHPLLSSAELAELRSAFDVFDRDGTGRVPVSVITATLRSLPPHPSHALLSSLLASSGPSSAALSFDDFVALLAPGPAGGGSSGRAEWERVFALMDEGGKGWLDDGDMERLRRTAVGGKGGGGGGGGGGKSELRAMLARADLNGDGVVSKDEFVALMMEDRML